MPPPSPEEERPFLVYCDSFLSLLGSSPSITCIAEDTRAPYFHSSGIFSPRTSTLFLSSSPVSDPSPSAAPSRNLATFLSKVDFYSSTDFSRDKVRTPDHFYMPRSGCAYKSGIVLCAQGTLAEPSALIFMDAKRPHKTYPLLTNFSGLPLNSPHSCIAHSDGSLWFSDPHLQHVPSFRPKPRLPPMLYRFDLGSGEVRPVASDLLAPTSLAFSPDYKTLYVLDSPAPTQAPATGHAGPTAASFPAIVAYTVSSFNGSRAPFLTHRRLFAMPFKGPQGLATDPFGNVYVGVCDGVAVYDVGGALVGKVQIDGKVSGVCFGRGGELWVSCGNKLWRVQMDKGMRPGTLGS